MAEKEPEFSITVGGITYTERTDGGAALISAMGKAKTGAVTELGSYKGFTLSVEKNFMGTSYIILGGKAGYKAETSSSAVGLMIRIDNVFDSIPEKVPFLENKIKGYRRNMEQAKKDFDKPFEYEEELKEKLARQFEINVELDLDKGDNEQALPQQEDSKQLSGHDNGGQFSGQDNEQPLPQPENSGSFPQQDNGGRILQPGGEDRVLTVAEKGIAYH